MKFFYLLCFLSIFQIFYSIELGGIKFAISEKNAEAILYHFYPDINEKISCFPINDYRHERGVNFREITAGISNFGLDKIKLKFTEKGININISGLKGWGKATLYINKFIYVKDKDVTADIKELSMNGNIYVTTKRDENNKLIPYAYFTEPPTYTSEIEVDVEDMIFNKDESVEEDIEEGLKKALDEAFKKNYNELLNMGLEKVKNLTVMPIDESKGLYIDYSLVDLKMKNGYIEINSFAFLFNKNLPETMEPKRIALTMLPSITSIDNPNQLFVSEYSINSALYTYFKTYPLSLKINVNTTILESLLPTITSKYADKTDVFLEITEPPSLSFQKNYIEGKILGRIIIKVKETKDLIFACTLQINTKVEIIIMEKTNVSGKLHGLSIVPKKVELNAVSKTFVTENVFKLHTIVLFALNEYISNNVKYTLPIFFKEVSIKHENLYLAINYFLKKETHYYYLDSSLKTIQKEFKQLYFKTNTATYRTVISQINFKISFILKTFFPDEEKILTNEYKPVKEASEKIPAVVQERELCEVGVIRLGNKISVFGENFPNNPIKNVGYQLELFMNTNYDFLKIPKTKSFKKQNTQDDAPKYDESFKKEFSEILNGNVATIACMIENAVINKQLISENYFIWHKFDFGSCFNYRNYVWNEQNK